MRGVSTTSPRATAATSSTNGKSTFSSKRMCPCSNVASDFIVSAVGPEPVSSARNLAAIA